jgi:hypothetical protein
MQELTYHHICIPTRVSRPDETYNEAFRLFASGYSQSPYGIEWMRFESECPLPELVKTVPHIGFVVHDLDAALADREVLVAPLSPADGVTTATIVYNGAPIEFLRFDRSESEVWPHDLKRRAMQGLKYHHFGVPTSTPRPEDRYMPEYKTYASGYLENPYGVEWMRFEPLAPIHELVRAVPHVAFVVDDLKEAIEGKEVLGEPNSPSRGITVAMIADNGAPVEFLQFDGPEFEVWPRNAKFRPE